MRKGYSLSLGKALAIAFSITVGTFIFSTAAIRMENSFIGWFWAFFMPVGWIGPAVVAIIGIAAHVRSWKQSGWVTYILGWLATLLWLCIVILVITWPVTPSLANIWQLVQMTAVSWALGWTALLVIFVVGLDRWIHTPKKSLTAPTKTPKLSLGNPV